MRCFTSKAKHRISSKLYLVKYNKEHRKPKRLVHCITFEWSQVVPWWKVFIRGFIWIHRIWSTDSKVRTISLPRRERVSYLLTLWYGMKNFLKNGWKHLIYDIKHRFLSFFLQKKKKKYDHEWLTRVSPKLTKLSLCTKIIVGRTPH